MTDDKKTDRTSDPAETVLRQAQGEDAPLPEDPQSPGKAAEVGLIDGVYPL